VVGVLVAVHLSFMGKRVKSIPQGIGMNMNEIRKALSFDDVLLVPGHSPVDSRTDIDLSVDFLGYKLLLPLISANMSTVTEFDMALEMHNAGGLGIIHRMCSIEDQCSIVKKLRHKLFAGPIAASFEIGGMERAKALTTVGCDIFCLDVAHADSNNTFEFLIKFVSEFSYAPLIIGNIATVDAATHIYNLLKKRGLWHERIAFKVGIGSGSQCTTRIVTGCGLPTLASLLEFRIKKALTFDQKLPYQLIADGGIKNSGDIVKALAAGADMVMLGSLLAGCKESPGNVIKHKGQLFKVYRGSASYGQKFEINKNTQYIE
jgi:IMP dehydrogenase